VQSASIQLASAKAMMIMVSCDTLQQDCISNYVFARHLDYNRLAGIRSNMRKSEFWKNFRLGEELSISGTFIYNGLRAYHNIHQLDHPEDVFEALYNLSVGIERLLKVAVVLLEHADGNDQKKLEESLITHNHLELLVRVKKVRSVPFNTPHNELLALLARFYKTYRYDRFVLSSTTALDKEKEALIAYFSKYLNGERTQNHELLGTPNSERYITFLRKITIKISSALYEIIQDRAHELNLYTYELRHESKAFAVFMGEADLPAEDTLWKELLLFFMNTKETSGYLEFLRSITPLDFDPALVEDYLECFHRNSPNNSVLDELHHHYEEIENKGERLEKLGVIGSTGVYFADPDQDEDL
jgi:hypothetical protein